MGPELEALTPREAEELVDSPVGLTEWLERHGLAWNGAVAAFLWERAAELPRAPVDDPRRIDGAELRGFVEQAARLTPRVAQVARLCLEDGVTLRECAVQLGVSRETVRVHLRRLRSMRRRAMARRGEAVAPAAIRRASVRAP